MIIWIVQVFDADGKFNRNALAFTKLDDAKGFVERNKQHYDTLEIDEVYLK